MSKIFLLIALIGLVSCSGQQQVEDEIGDQRSFDPLINYEDNERVKVICDAIQAKEGMLNVLVSSAKEYSFNYSHKSCDDSAMSEEKIVPTKIMKNGNGYYFSPKNGEAFGFSDVETTKDGIMQLICNYGGTLESPIRSSPTSKTAIWWSTFTDASHCQSGFGNICINIQTGSSSDGYNFTIHTNEWVKFQVVDENQGFFLERKVISKAGCKKGKTLEMRAKLR